jgi:arginine utilization regulatory protein
LRLRVPPLHERREDIPILIEHFLRRHQQEAGKQGLRLSDEARALMFDYHWPGNVREMENVLYRLAAFTVEGEAIGPERFLEEVGVYASPPAIKIVGGRIVIDAHLSYRERQRELERLSIISALNDTGGNIRQAAAKLGMCRNSLRDKIKKLGINT